MEQWRRLGREIALARRRRGWTQAQLATRAGVNTRTVGRLENAAQTAYDPSTLVGVELALGWAHGSAEAILAGSRPDEESDEDLVQLVGIWRQLGPRERAAILTLAEQLAGR